MHSQRVAADYCDFDIGLEFFVHCSNAAEGEEILGKMTSMAWEGE